MSYLKLIRKFWFIPLVIMGLALIQMMYYPDFDFYKKDKVTLMNTQVLVKEVRQIGELITAEYYGEVYGGLLEYYNEIPQSLLNDPPDSLKRALPYITQFKKSFYQNKITRAQMRNLVYIGRGWVKAGVDLQKITEKDIALNGQELLVYLPKPKILIHDINPWYVDGQDLKVPGFELFMERRKSWKFTNQEVKAVKMVCKNKLVQDALDEQLLSKAEKNSLEVMKNFLQLLGFEKVNVQFKGL